MEGEPHPLPVGRAEIMRRGRTGAIWAIGNRVGPALRAAESLEAEGIDLTVVNARWVKPLDRGTLAETVPAHSRLITVEDHSIAGGFGSAVMEALQEMRVPGVEVVQRGVPDRFVPHATQKEQWREAGIDEEGIAAAARELFAKPRPVTVAFRKKT
jgi:1-deoxy-D-xylulose-5-phosphate synthase